MPPSIIDQIREQQAWEQPKKSGSVGFIIGTIAAFGAGIVGVVAWGALPQLSIAGLTAATRQAAAPAAAKQPELAISAKGRIGNAAESKLLRTCVPTETMGMDGDMPKKDIYRILQIGSQMSRIANIAKIKQDAVDETEFAGLWAEVADCVYRQNGWMLCDPDNRALAVEAVSTLTRLAGVASAKPAAAKDPNGAPRTFASVRAEVDGRRAPAARQKLQSVHSVKERVLATLKMRAQEGRFVASDFSVLAPAEVVQVMKDTKPTSDACANKS
jgi:hypothetical protein